MQYPSLDWTHYFSAVAIIALLAAATMTNAISAFKGIAIITIYLILIVLSFMIRKHHERTGT